MRGSEYLQALAGNEYCTDPEQMVPKFSIYKYDAWRCPRIDIAQQVVRALRKDSDEKTWYVVHFNKFSGEVRVCM